MGYSTLYLTNYNNYYNRQVRVLTTLAEYNDYILNNITNVSFNPSDGIMTHQIINYNIEIGIPTYLLVVNELNEIDSRWFILDMKRTLAGQYDLTLYRDTIADYLPVIQNAPIFVEKGILPEEDPMIFNNENMTYNRIKKSETLLKDNTGCPWLVGYYSRNYAKDPEGKVEAMKGTVNTNTPDDTGVYEILETPIEQWEYYPFTTQNYVSNPFSLKYLVEYQQPNVSRYSLTRLSFNKSGNYEGTKSVYRTTGGLTGRVRPEEAAAIIENNIKNNYGADKLFKDTLSFFSYNTKEDVNALLKYNGKTIKDSNGRYFEATITSTDNISEYKKITAGSLYETFKSIYLDDTGITGIPKDKDFAIISYSNQYLVVLKELKDYEVSYDLTGAKLITEDAPYNIFAIPYGEVRFWDSIGNIVCDSETEVGLDTAMSIIQQNPGTIYDLQLLPYCPCSDWVSYDPKLHQITLPSNLAYSKVSGNSGTKTVILNVPKSKFSFDLFLEKPIVIKNAKIENETDLYRLVSPNYQGQFEFSAAKNRGIEFFNVDCYYKPFSPYIHLNPNFNGLYGRDFDDARGLVCGGDFSLTQITDQWRQYQLNNKNYLNSFDRQIENMEINNNFQRVGEWVNAGVGALTGAASGGVMGGMYGGGIGTGIGAAVGGVASFGAGVADIAINEALRNEAMDYTKDQFGFQLGNIQALPYTLNKVSAFTANNKLFPFLEYYTCSNEEKKALTDKIRYNGMTVGRIGTMKEFLGYSTREQYFKGKLIRLYINEDTHFINTLAAELNKGVYIGGKNE